MAADQLRIGTASDDLLEGGDGNDTLIGLGGDDVLAGNAGDDLLIGNIGGSGSGTLLGGAGSDTLLGGDGENQLDGGLDADFLFGGSGSDLLAGGGGADALVGGGGSDTLDGGADTDLLIGGGGADLLIGGDGDDWIEVDDADLSADGGEGSLDLLLIAGGAERLAWIDLGRSDNQNAGGGGPVLTGFEAVDAAGAPSGVRITGAVHHGGLGNILSGSVFADTLVGSAAADIIDGRDGDDLISGGGGNDTIAGGAGVDLAAYAGNLADYEVTETEDGVIVRALAGEDGTDTLIDVEWLQFADRLIEVGVPIPSPTNLPPVAVADPIATAEDSAVTFWPAANDSDPEGGPLTVTGIVSAPGLGTATLHGDGSVTYAPAANFHGGDSFLYRVVDDGGAGAIGTVTITVSPVNDPPAAVADSVATAEDTALAFQPKSNDTDIDGDALTIDSIVTAPAHGTVAITANNALSYTPAANYFGPDSLVYRVSDGHGGSAQATVSVTVTPVNDAPVALADAVSTDAGAAVTFSPLANDSDVDGDGLILTGIAAGPAHGTATINAGGSLTYTPAAGYVGDDSLTYAISDGHGAGASASVGLTVLPVATGPGLWVGPGETYARLSDAIAASEDGDTIYVRAGTYLNDFAVVNHAVSIIGVGGLARLEATQLIPNGKAILITRNDVTIQNLEFVGARVDDQNGAGIRYEGGNLIVRDSYFHDNEEGILAASVPTGTILIETSEFARNGFGDGYTHGIYVNDVAQLTVVDSYFHDTHVGHHIKSRAEHTTIEGNTIDDGVGGTASYSIDLPNGGAAIIRGNTITQSAASENPTLINYGGEGGPYPGSSLLVEDNTLINQRASAVGVYNRTDVVVEVRDNIVTNLPTLVVGPNQQSGNTTGAQLDLGPMPDYDGGSFAEGDALAVAAGVVGDGHRDEGVAQGEAGPELLFGSIGDLSLVGVASADTTLKDVVLG